MKIQSATATVELALTCQTMLSPDSNSYRGQFTLGPDGWKEFRIDERLNEPIKGSYVVPMLPIEFHCHGVGPFDFTDIPKLKLDEINDHFAGEGVRGILTLYLPQPHLDAFLRMMKEFAAAKQAGQLPYIAGVALEGPVLGSFGGTPEIGVWTPTRDEWKNLARCGELGLQYIVLSPDASMAESSIFASKEIEQPSVEWICELLLDHGVRPALGHFWKNNPEASANCINKLLDIAERVGTLPAGHSVITDHLFNDMPRKFKHCWRTPAERTHREADLASMDLPSLTMENLVDRLGIVPATIMQAAKDRRLTVCLNFDGEHVDLAISRSVVELLGADCIIAMTDRIDSKMLGGQRLLMPERSSLLYQSQGIVAAGSQPLTRQVENMRSIGLSEEDIWKMTSFVPSRVLGIKEDYDEAGRPRSGYVVTADHQRHVFSYV